MCWPENDASEKNKAKTGELSKSNACNSSAAGRPWCRGLKDRPTSPGWAVALHQANQVRLACPDDTFSFPHKMHFFPTIDFLLTFSQ